MGAAFDFAPLLTAGLPPPAAKWTGLAKYSFIGGNNDPEQVPVDGLIDAVNAVLRREGRNLATYGLAHGPQGYLPLRRFLSAKLKRDAAIAATADDIMIVSGSLQALDLVNHTLLARGDTVIVEQETYQGSLNRLSRLGVNAVGIPLDRKGMRMDALAAALADLKARDAQIAILSNGTPRMLAAAVESAGMSGLFDAVLSVDAVRVYKPRPEVYALVTDGFRIGPGDVVFVSSNRWDVMGAASFGFRPLWVNRARTADEYPDHPPTREVAGLAGLASLHL